MTAGRTPSINGVIELPLNRIADRRGSFTKTYRETLMTNENLPTVWREEYFTVSRKNVLRGMHFQTPPHQHDKIVYCVAGSVFDVIIDLRKHSSTYLKIHHTELTETGSVALFIPHGCAHGFLSLQNNTILAYKVTSDYSPAHDRGVLWSSIGIKWPVRPSEVIVSQRDQMHPILADYTTPF